MRELGYEVSSHMARLTADQEQMLREAVERQERGAPTVRPVHTAAAAISHERVAEVVGTVELEQDTEWDSSKAAPPTPVHEPAAPAPAERLGPPQPKKKRETRRSGHDRDVMAEQLAMEEELEGREMVAEEPAEDFIGPPLPPEGLVAETGVRTIDLNALEDPIPAPGTVVQTVRGRPALPVRGSTADAGRTRRERRERGRRRGVRTLTRRKRSGPKVSIQATMKLTVSIPITLKDLSQNYGVRAQDMIKTMMTSTGQFGFSMNTVMDEEQVLFLADEFNRDVTIVAEKDAEERLEEKILEAEVAVEGDAQPRPAVVTILGHVDHGKTTLLDKIRDTKVVDSEHGGITQHIGAFQVETPDGQKVTFLDTPGHAAFTAMRARGAQAADIVILVVAADDGIMPQTEEAIEHAKQANVQIVVAINKIDRPNANVTKVKQQLSAHGLTPEEWGGETVTCEVSAITGEGIENLLEMLALTAEVEEYQASPDVAARGIVIEGRKDPHRGVICTLLVREGTARRGDIIIAGMGTGRIRRMQDHLAQTVKEAPPSMPIEVFGLDEVPGAGDPFYVVKDMSLAKKVVAGRELAERNSIVKDRPQVTLATLFGEDGADEESTLRIILKADVRGSLEPLKGEIEKLEHPEVKIDLLYAGLGAVTKSDVDNAIASNAVIMGFHVLDEPAAKKWAKRQGVEVRHYTVIYHMIDDLRAAMEKLLSPEQREEITGHAEIRKIFTSSRLGNLAGSNVIDGFIRRDDYIRLYRGGKLLYGAERKAKADGLRREKDDAKEVREGFDCGILISAYQDIQEGDVIEFYAIKEVKRSLGV